MSETSSAHKLIIFGKCLKPYACLPSVQAWDTQQGIQFASNGPMDPTAYAAAAPALGMPQYGASRPDDDSGEGPI